MATKNYIDLTGLTRYDELIKNYIDTADADKIDKVDSTYVNSIPTVDSQGGIQPSGVEFGELHISESGYRLLCVSGNQINDTDIDADDLEVVIETVNSLADVATSGAAEDVSYDNTTSGLTADDVQEAIDELAEASQGGVASKTVYITETAGTSSDAFSKRYGIYQGATGSSRSPVVSEKIADIDIPKDMVVEDGSVVDITYDNGHLYDGSTDVTEIIKGAGGTATSADAGKYIKLEIANATSSVLYIKATDLVDIYTAEQNARQVQISIDSSNVISATIVAGSIGTTELANGAVTSGKIALGAVDNKKLAENAVGTTNIYDYAVTADKLASNSVTTAKIADDAVTADKIAISAHTEAKTAGADGLALSVTTTDGQVSAVSGSIAANTYDAYGAASTAKSEVIGTSGDAASANTIYGAKAYADSAASGAETYADGLIAALDASVSQAAGTDGLALALTEVDGVVTAISGSISSGTYDAYGAASTAKSEVIGTSGDAASASTIYGAKAYADAATGSVPTSSIEALFA